MGGHFALLLNLKVQLRQLLLLRLGWGITHLRSFSRLIEARMRTNQLSMVGVGTWKASELRLKSRDDLHKLWYVLLKEENMLMTQHQMLNSQNLRFPNPERIPKVRKSMCRIKHVLTERAIEDPDPRRSSEMKRLINAL